MSERLDLYIKKCIMDEYNLTNKDLVWSDIEWYYLVIGKQIIFYINTPYPQINKKIKRRIRNNVGRNFFLKTEGKYFLSNTIQYGATLSKIIVNKKSYYICVVGNDWVYEYKELCKEYFKNTHNPKILPKMNWNEYKKLYYNTYKTNVDKHLRIKTCSDNVKIVK